MKTGENANAADPHHDRTPESGAGKEIRTPDLLITSEAAVTAVLPDEAAGHARAKDP
jgi:hypothetical protein